jgi:predicted heme/steroid binding protein
MDRWMEYFQGKLSDQGQINSEFEVEEFDFNVANNGISEPRYLKIRGTKYILAEYYLWSRLTHIKLFTTSRFRTTSCQKG